MQQRIQKIIARAGIASRRKAEELITQGRVRVNGKVVSTLGSKADPEHDAIRVDGKRLSGSRRPPLYLMVNKPRQYITSTEDPRGRRTVMDLLGKYQSRVYPVGRLDYLSEGLLLFTNDGDFANRILSAKNEVPKTYHVKINGNPTADQVERFRKGLRLNGRTTAPARIRLIRPGDNPWFEVTLIEGRTNQIRRMFKQLGFLVEKLKRVKIGPLALGALPTGKCRPLDPTEVDRFRKLWEKRQKSRRRTDPTAP